MQAKEYFEKKVSLLSTSDVRYTGELYTIDPTEQSIALKHVNCMGTETRRTGDQAIAPSDCTYEFIIFRAVNIRQLWLQQDANTKIDLTDEILVPLRQGQNVNNYQAKGRQDKYGQQQQHHQEPPKRKVGYQSRSSSQQQQQGYDPYYQPPPPQRGGYDNYGYGRSAGYGPPPVPPNRQYAPPPQQQYYDAPNDGGYYYNRQSGAASYREQRQSYNNGYRQRPAQYYNPPQRTPQRTPQRAPQYYNQGYADPYRYGYVNQPQPRSTSGQRRPYGYEQSPRQRGYGSYSGAYAQQPQRGYNRGDGQRTQTRGRGRGDQAGTGAFLDNRRLRGDEIDIKDQQDFDFGAAKNEFDLSKDDEQIEANGGVMDNNADSKPIEDEADSGSKAQAPAETSAVEKNKEEEETKRDDEDVEESETDAAKKYNKAKSFFDGLQTETKRSKPRQDLQAQKDVDTKTFGSVAASYKSRHINRPYQGRPNRTYQNRSYGSYQQNSRNYQQSDRYYNQRQGQQTTQQANYSTNKWVVRR